MTIHTALIGGPLSEDQDEARPGPGGAPEMQHPSIRQIWNVVRRHRLMLLLVVGVSVVTVLVTQLLATPMYRAVATVQVELNDDTGINQADMVARNQQRVANEARIYGSRALAERVVQELQLDRDPRFIVTSSTDPDRAVSQASRKLVDVTEVYHSKDSDFIDIAVRTSSPDLAATIANQFVESLQTRRINRRNARKESIALVLNEEKDRLARETQQAEQAVAQFRRRSGMLVGAGGAEDYAQLNRIEVESASASAMRAASAARSAGVARAAGIQTTAGATSPLLDQQQRQYDDLLREKSKLAVVYGARHPEMQRVEAQIGELRGNMGREQASVIADEQARAGAMAAREQGLAQSEAAAAAARANHLEGRLSRLAGQAFSNTSNAVELAKLERRAEVARLAFLTAAQSAQEVNAERETTGVNSLLVSPAAVPDEPISPAPKKTTLAAFCGSLMLGLLMVFAIEMFDNKLRTSEQIRRLFGLPTLAMFPQFSGSSVVSPDDNPVIRDPQSVFAEVARTLSAEVAQLAVQGKPQTVLLTSPLPGDGKSTIAITLVAAAASMGRRAIVVDLDLRRPGGGILQTVQNQLDTPDLIDYLTGRVESQKLLSSAMLPSSEREITRYTPVILSTRTAVRDPASLIQIGKIRELFETLRERFDLIVINAPATLAVRDARTLTDLADITLMVVRWGHTTIEQMQAAIQLLQNKVDGAVINMVDYVEHARRGYGDSVEFYVDSAVYYSDPIPRRGWTEGLRDRARRFFTRGTG